jgi:hypothetical protein
MGQGFSIDAQPTVTCPTIGQSSSSDIMTGVNPNLMFKNNKLAKKGNIMPQPTIITTTSSDNTISTNNVGEPQNETDEITNDNSVNNYKYDATGNFVTITSNYLSLGRNDTNACMTTSIKPSKNTLIDDSTIRFGCSNSKMPSNSGQISISNDSKKTLNIFGMGEQNSRKVDIWGEEQVNIHTNRLVIGNWIIDGSSDKLYFTYKNPESLKETVLGYFDTEGDLHLSKFINIMPNSSGTVMGHLSSIIGTNAKGPSFININNWKIGTSPNDITETLSISNGDNTRAQLDKLGNLSLTSKGTLIKFDEIINNLMNLSTSNINLGKWRIDGSIDNNLVFFYGTDKKVIIDSFGNMILKKDIEYDRNHEYQNAALQNSIINSLAPKKKILNDEYNEKIEEEEQLENFQDPQNTSILPQLTSLNPCLLYTSPSPRDV